MTICAVVAEYNSYHNGHRYHIEQTKEAGADAVIAIMSGSFVQRGEPALLSKFSRAKTAVQCGVDLVLELPVPYATASSERFAEGAVATAQALGCVGLLSFGSECKEMDTLAQAAAAVSEPAVVARTKELYEQGDSYPVARRAAVAEIFGEPLSAVLDSPNNLLAVDYIKALQKLRSDIRPFTVARQGAAHDGDGQQDGFASASEIRKRVRAGQDVAALVPPAAAQELEAQRAAGAIGGGWALIERLVLHKLRGMQKEEMAALPDCADGLGHRLYAASADAASIETLCRRAKTRRYTLSRVRRAVTAAVLGIDAAYYTPPPYARILAIGEKGLDILGAMKTSATVPFSHDIALLAKQGPDAQRTAMAEIRATDLFALTTEKIGPRGQDYTQKLFKVEHAEV